MFFTSLEVRLKLVTDSGLLWLSVSTSTISICTFLSPAATVSVLAAVALTLLNTMLPGRNCDTTASQPSAGTPVVLLRVMVIEPSSADDFTTLASFKRVVMRLVSSAVRPL